MTPKPSGGSGARQSPGMASIEEDSLTSEEAAAQLRRENLWECFNICIFLVFLAIFTLVMLVEQSASSSRFADHLRLRLEGGAVPLASVSTVAGYYDYLEQALVPALYENTTDTHMAARMSRFLHPLDMSNRLMGSPRIRQARVKQANDCQVSPMFGDYSFSCYPQFSAEVEDKAAFGPDYKFSYTEDTQAATDYAGSLATYSSHGYMQTLSTNRTHALQTIHNLRRDGFLGPATRAVFVDYTVWNTNIGTYAVISIIVEFGASGGVKPFLDILTMKEQALVPEGLGTANEWWVLFGVISLYVPFILYFIIVEIFEIRIQKLDYLFDGWNVMDWVNMILLLVALVVRVTNFAEASDFNIGQRELVNKDAFVNYRKLAENTELVRLLHAFNAVLLWIKVAKYLRHMPIVRDLIRTVWGALSLFLPFLCMFTVAFIGFSMSYNIGFGDKIWKLSTFGSTTVYLLRAFLRDIKLMPVYELDPGFGALLILIFYVTMMLVGMNVLFAIMADAIFRSKHDKHTKDSLLQTENGPVEEFQELLWSCVPGSVKRCFSRCRKNLGLDLEEEPQEDGGDDAAMADTTQPGFALQDGTATEGDGSGPRARPVSYRLQGLEDQSVSSRSGSEKLLTRHEIMRAIELMSGRVLSEISIVGIEVRSELHDVCERVAQMHMAVEELTSRTRSMKVEQERAMT
eukprot:CAMPEP_0179346246 /NCGR_PEP_ID=MMETSP0797-20121207/72471_1 /TAXON_ID=47934 /ORGANISM="Dinophysis acuminata, Strain DAEP01" /LENGTH=687 /DNA_ID=CAMNT_0021060781 /DNA_START=75 /DNA_END=2138 /DNA_ORIENTATION=-